MSVQEINHINSKDVNIDDVSPAMQHYLKTKQEYSNGVLLYRMGDFYETFFEDAVLMLTDM